MVRSPVCFLSDSRSRGGETKSPEERSAVPAPIKTPPPQRLQVVKKKRERQRKKTPKQDNKSPQAWRTSRLSDSCFVRLATSRAVRATVRFEPQRRQNLVNMVSESPRDKIKIPAQADCVAESRKRRESDQFMADLKSSAAVKKEG